MNKKATSDPDNKHPIQETIDNFLNCIEGLRAYAPLIDLILSEIAEKRSKDLEEEADKFGKINRKKKGAMTLSVPVDRAYKVRKKIDELGKITAAHRTFPSMIILPLVGQYDAFVADLLKVLFQKRPERIFTSDRQVTFSEISELNSIEDIKKLNN